MVGRQTGQKEKIKMTKTLIDALKGKPQKTPPVWLMRQAGRYLPEYRDLRASTGGFLDLVYNPDKASEVTMQPVRRFGMDGAILFSDILVVPHALGQQVEVLEGEGPKLDPLQTPEDFKRLSQLKFQDHLKPILETIRQTKSKLQHEGFDNTALIGFSGSPWTLACYMIDGGSSRDFVKTKLWAYNDPNSFADLMDLLCEAIIQYLNDQIDAGVEAVQLFDSWAGLLDHNMFNRWVIKPTRKIVEGVREYHPDVPIIGFPRNAGRLALDYAQSSKVSALSLDSQTAPKWAASVYQNLMPVQGNLDPVCLLAGGLAMQSAVEDILVHLGKGPFVFNLGHGVIKETPAAHVEELVAMIRDWK